MYYSFKKIIAEIENGDKITICDNDILSYGSNRVCYLHKTNPSKLIKIARHLENWESDHRQSFSEWYVSKKVASHSMECRLSLCQQWVQTNKGPGLVVDRVVDDKGQSVTLRKLLFRKEVSVESALKLVERIISNFSLIGVPASDFNIDNFILEGNHHNNRLIMVDGFSPKKLNLKTRILLSNKRLANLYTKRKWNQAKARFSHCAQKVYAGDYSYAAAVPLNKDLKNTSDDIL